MSDDRQFSDEVSQAFHRAGAVGGALAARPDVKSVKIRVVVKRADGTQEPLGVVSASHKSPLKQWIWLRYHDARELWRRWRPVKGKLS